MDTLIELVNEKLNDVGEGAERDALFKFMGGLQALDVDVPEKSLNLEEYDKIAKRYESFESNHAGILRTLLKDEDFFTNYEFLTKLVQSPFRAKFWHESGLNDDFTRENCRDLATELTNFFENYEHFGFKSMVENLTPEGKKEIKNLESFKTFEEKLKYLRGLTFAQMREEVFKLRKKLPSVTGESGDLIARVAEKDPKTTMFDSSFDCTAPHGVGNFGGMNFWANFAYMNMAEFNYLNFYVNSEAKDPVARAYLYLMHDETSGKPVLVVDSLEYSSDYYKYKDLNPFFDLIADYAEALNVTAIIKGRMSNHSEDVKGFVAGKFEKEDVSLEAYDVSVPAEYGAYLESLSLGSNSQRIGDHNAAAKPYVIVRNEPKFKVLAGMGPVEESSLEFARA
ncbi:MAG: hypothetical protein GOV15_02875 [Candidatus Diapherotrites archaeon]|nr:hypothetical protein [Candidatus Diapherotrites archaeon]